MGIHFDRCPPVVSQTLPPVMVTLAINLLKQSMMERRRGVIFFWGISLLSATFSVSLLLALARGTWRGSLESRISSSYPRALVPCLSFLVWSGLLVQLSGVKRHCNVDISCACNFQLGGGVSHYAMARLSLQGTYVYPSSRDSTSI